MRSKKRGIIFSAILIALMASGVYFMYIKKDTPQTEQTDKMTISDEEMASLDDTLQKEQESLLAEREEFFNKCLEVDLSPEYHDGIYCETYNKDFVKEQCKFRNIYGMVDYEFVGYEELDNLCEYAEGVDWENRDELWKTGWASDVENLFLKTGFMNSDGTFNPQERRVIKRNEDGSLGEEKIYENSELVAVKITMRYTNLSAKENDVYYLGLHYLQCNIYGEDGEMYPMSNVYGRNIFFESYSPIYKSISPEKYPVITSEQYGTSHMISEIKLQPYEEYTCDLIYVVFKDELENMCFVSHFGVNGDEFNYKDLGTNIVMFSYLKETLGGKE